MHHCQVDWLLLRMLNMLLILIQNSCPCEPLMPVTCYHFLYVICQFHSFCEWAATWCHQSIIMQVSDIVSCILLFSASLIDGPSSCKFYRTASAVLSHWLHSVSLCSISLCFCYRVCLSNMLSLPFWPVCQVFICLLLSASKTQLHLIDVKRQLFALVQLHVSLWLGADFTAAS